jgi:hypothetical protein
MKTASTDYAFERRPVIRLNMIVPCDSPGTLETRLIKRLRSIARKEGLPPESAVCRRTGLRDQIAKMRREYGARPAALMTNTIIP